MHTSEINPATTSVEFIGVRGLGRRGVWRLYPVVSLHDDGAVRDIEHDQHGRVPLFTLCSEEGLRVSVQAGSAADVALREVWGRGFDNRAALDKAVALALPVVVKAAA